MMSKQNVPELRFPEFSGEWEERKLGKISQNAMYGMNTAATDFDGENVYVRITDIEEQSRKLNTKDFTSPSEINDRYLLNEEDILFARTGASTGKSYLHRSLNQNLKYYFAGFLIKFELKGGFNPNFIYPQTLTQKYDKWVKVMSMRSGQPGINGKEYSLLPIHTTSEEEQEKIGEFFNKLDRLIELEEKKLELLEEQKKGYMQKIFSQELRFKDENGNDYPEWEEKKLGEILGERVERSANGELLSVTISEGIKPFSQLDRKNNSSDNKDNYKKVYVGDIAYNSMRMWQGASGYSPYEGIVSPAYTVLYRKSEIDMEFMSYYFKTYQLVHTFKKFSQGLTSDTWNLKYPLLKTIPVYICSLNEQKKILSFFVKLDYRISQQKIKVNKMKLEKQGLIQRMFL